MPTMQANDVEIYYEAFGDPSHETLLLVNGLGTQAVGYETEFCEGLVSKGLHVIRFDNRDVGLSTHLEAEVPDVFETFAAVAAGGEVHAPYTLSDLAADAVGLLDGLSIDAAHIFGSSMGGMIVQTMAIESPSRVRSVTSVMSTTGEPEYGMPDPDCLGGLASIMVPAETREERIASGIALQKLIGTPGSWDADRVRDRVSEQVDRSYDPEGTARQMTAILASGSRAEGLAELDVPMMVLHGDADRLVNITGGRRTAELVKDAEFRLMEGMAHDLPPSHWERAIDAVATVTGKGR
jgi:pimeloyl-ACP methyl ester carboxylesterase